jgi:cysteinyl-tRNA synthetase, unknown class
MPKTGLYLLQGISPDTVATSPFDVRVIDPYDDNGTPWSAQQVVQMGGGSADPHLLLGYFSIGEAEVYRDYYSTIPKDVLGPEDPQWQGNYEVAFWTSSWKDIATRYVDNLIKAGYDGVYFDVVDEFQTDWAKSQIADPAKAMADLVKALADHARAQNPDFKIWVNGAEELLANDTYFKAIDGMFKENLYYTDSGEKQPAEETQASLEFLKKMVDAGKDVIAIEYVSGSEKIADVHAQSDRDGLGSYVAHLNLDSIDLDGVRDGQGSGLGTVTTPPPAPPAGEGTGSGDDAAGGASPPKVTAPDKAPDKAPVETPGQTDGATDPHAGPSTDPETGGRHDAFHFSQDLFDRAAHTHHADGSAHGSGHGAAHMDAMSLYLQHSCGADHPAFAA